MILYLGTGFSILLFVVPLRLCMRSILPASIAAAGTPIGAGGAGGGGGPGGGGGGGGGIATSKMVSEMYKNFLLR